MPVNRDAYVTAFEELFEKARHIREQVQELCVGLVELQVAYANAQEGDADLVDEGTEAYLKNKLGRTATPSVASDRVSRSRASRATSTDEPQQLPDA